MYLNIRFIYCGNVDLRMLQGSEVLKLLIVVNEFNNQPLISCVQEYLIEKQSEFLHQNLVGILETVHQHEAFTNLLEFCLGKICEETEILFNFDKVVNLKAPILELLLKRDDLNLDQIIVWDHLIKWCLAQNPTISQDVSKWSKEEVTVMKRTLHRYIPLISFYHISSENFFYKVLPYKKLLPKRLIYEISEFHMVPKKKLSANIHPSRQPKSLNYDSVIIESQQFALFASWIDKKNVLHYNIPYKFNLLYRASRDGLSANEFHEKCDNKGATIIVIKIKDSDQLIGGYNPLTWDKSDTTKSTPDSFIFSLINKTNVKICRVVNVAKAIHCYGNQGPSFGPNYDLFYNAAYNVWFCSPYNYPSTDLPFIKRNFGVNNFDAEDYEVFQVIKN